MNKDVGSKYISLNLWLNDICVLICYIVTDFYVCVCKENEMKVHVMILKFAFDF